MPEDPAPQENSPLAEACVLDTQVVLEVFWFRDPRARTLREALSRGRLRWLASPAMRLELASVLPRLPDRESAPERGRVLTSFDCWANLRDAPPTAPLRCSDPDDQMFADLALACGARWLFTRDRALLRLARPAAKLGCLIVPPERHGALAPAAARDGARPAG